MLSLHYVMYSKDLCFYAHERHFFYTLSGFPDVTTDIYAQNRVPSKKTWAY